jgi:ATP-binding protein involved in chromosome partitioning
VKAIPGVTSVMVALTAERKAGAAAPPQQRPTAPPQGRHAGPGAVPAQGPTSVEGVGAIIAVASGKGGVGKSTTAVNLALGLRDLGLRVGLLDADIYGPSTPKLLGIKGRPQTRGGTTLIPMDGYGLKVMSIGFLIEEETPMIWRGPMVMSALTQMLREVDWGELDIMVVDMPPGTGDAQLTMAQQVPLKGAVIVSTPQDLALIDARRGIAMFNRVNVPVLGIVENMSYFLCPECGTRSDIFGHGGARREAERLGVPFLGEVPLHMEIREKSDAGLPVVATAPDGAHARIYRDIAARVRDQMAGRVGKAAPKIVIEA